MENDASIDVSYTTRNQFYPSSLALLVFLRGLQFQSRTTTHDPKEQIRHEPSEEDRDLRPSGRHHNLGLSMDQRLQDDPRGLVDIHRVMSGLFLGIRLSAWIQRVFPELGLHIPRSDHENLQLPPFLAPHAIEICLEKGG